MGFIDQVNRVLKLIDRSEFEKAVPPIIRYLPALFGRG